MTPCRSWSAWCPSVSRVPLRSGIISRVAVLDQPIRVSFPLPVRGPFSALPPRPRKRPAPARIVPPRCFACRGEMDLRPGFTDLWECEGCEVRETRPPHDREPIDALIGFGGVHIKPVDHARVHSPHP